MQGTSAVELCPICKVRAGAGACTTCRLVSGEAVGAPVAAPEFTPMPDDVRAEQVLAARDALRKGIRACYKAGAQTGTVGVGFDHTATNGQLPYWARCKAQIGRAHRDVTVEGYPTGIDALAALADHLADLRRRSTRGRL